MPTEITSAPISPEVEKKVLEAVEHELEALVEHPVQEPAQPTQSPVAPTASVPEEADPYRGKGGCYVIDPVTGQRRPA